MSAPNPAQLPSAQDLKLLSESLQQLRDAMVEFSLFIKDRQCELASQDMQAVAQETKAVIQRVKSSDRPQA